jgi:putative protease
MTALELLAPARTAEIGIAAIDCGADAVYIAGPAFGARQAAGNSVEDIARLCEYAHRFGVRIYATVNTIVYEEELEEARSLVDALAKAGVDALIIQDPAVLEMARSAGIIAHASTQCAIRTPEKARFTESLGYGRLVLERELSLEQIKAIRTAVNAEIEFFVHGALCVCYSGQCYLSEYLTGRSANRGECAQACRNLYNLEDASGKVLVRNKALLSLKDFNLLHRLEELADAGVCSFKIEGRLKSESYVRNVVKAYSEALDALIARRPDQYRRSSFGEVRGGFAPNLDKTFNRGYTELFLDGKRGQWSSMDAPKSMGEYVGTVKQLTRDGLVIAPATHTLQLSNGDGFAFVGKDGGIGGFRADVCEGYTIRCKRVEGLQEGMDLYRNISAAFEKELEVQRPERVIRVSADIRFIDDAIEVAATAEDGRKADIKETTASEAALNPQRMLETIKNQLEKRSGHYAFSVRSLEAGDTLPFMPASFLNGIRRSLAEQLDRLPVNTLPLQEGKEDLSENAPEVLDYKANIANSKDRSLYASRGTRQMEQAYELAHRPGAELMRSKYCIRHELGLCPKQGKAQKAGPLFLRNGKERLQLTFHCAQCEMTVSAYRI